MEQEQLCNVNIHINSDFSLIRTLLFKILCGLLNRRDYRINLCRSFDICSLLACFSFR